METINDKNLNEIEILVDKLNEKKFRAKQIYKQIHNNKINDFFEMTDIPLNLREKLSLEYCFSRVKKIHEYDSKLDGTKKYLFELNDGNVIETVFMPYKKRNTLCISTQVGCAMGCKFCASTKNGFIRNLTSSELIEQTYEIERINGDISNIVIMGIGEPFYNYDNLVKYIKIITDKNGRNLSHRSITVSTSGIVEKIYEMANENLDVNLAVSLHFSNDELRRKYMPIGKKYSIEEIVEACDYYFKNTGRRVSYEYMIISGVNDTDKDAFNLHKLFFGKNILINLITLNPIKEFKNYKSDLISTNNFANKLTKLGLNVSIRKSMGKDINASCGQLRNKYEEKNGI
ncbi:MAG: 23S rRNA (adenine(2503)-C(2))-methyltransferase RlmN [Peptoniphilaceae bacterium]|nr:23S rRNA (adenine(2503)-C(2))-methyltransferase RlmN [Peptoniphilaceae bacterium]MDY3738195.1 23S rRNA (adenine(2503)-C(2))-methyltransferase RlmN [Peptoniphilaceae bacterium]